MAPLSCFFPKPLGNARSSRNSSSSGERLRRQVPATIRQIAEVLDRACRRACREDPRNSEAPSINLLRASFHVANSWPTFRRCGTFTYIRSHGRPLSLLKRKRLAKVEAFS